MVKTQKGLKKNVIISSVNFQKNYYIPLPFYDKKKEIVSPDNFFIPKISEYDLLIKNNYRVPQLKKICKFYNQKVSGKKQDLLHNIYNYLYYSNSAIKIQKLVKGFLQRKLNKSYGEGFLKRDICTNKTDFFTLEDLKDIDYEQFYSFKDNDGFVYGFNIISLYNLIIKSETEPINPYTRNNLPKNLVTSLRNHIRLSRVLGIKIDIDIKNDGERVSPAKKLELRTLSLFQEIDGLGNYSDPNWFLTLSNNSIIRYLRELHDIWVYRAQLSNEVRLSICPPVGDPFRGTNISYLNQLSQFNLKKLAVSIMEKLVKNGTSRDSQSLGAFYVLASLTLVNNDAADALPWLYQSVSHIV